MHRKSKCVDELEMPCLDRYTEKGTVAEDVDHVPDERIENQENVVPVSSSLNGNRRLTDLRQFFVRAT